MKAADDSESSVSFVKYGAEQSAAAISRMRILVSDLVSEGEMIALLSRSVAEQSPAKNFESVDFYEAVARFEITLIEEALRCTNGNQVRAARLLNMNASTLNAKIKHYHTTKITFVREGKMKRIFLLTLTFVMLATVGKTSAQNQAPLETRVETEAIASYNQGTTLHQAGKYQEAISAFKRSLRLKPDFAWAYNNLGVAYLDAGFYSEAVALFKESLRFHKEFAEARRNLGCAYYHLGRFSEAVLEYEQAIRLKPDFAAAYTDLGATLSKLNNHSEAIKALEKASRLNPQSAPAFNNLGCAYSRAGQNKKAIKAFVKSLALNSEYAEAHFNLAAVFLAEGNHNSAVEQYVQLKSLNAEFAYKLYKALFTIRYTGQALK